MDTGRAENFEDNNNGRSLKKGAIKAKKETPKTSIWVTMSLKEVKFRLFNTRRLSWIAGLSTWFDQDLNPGDGNFGNHSKANDPKYGLG